MAKSDPGTVSYTHLDVYKRQTEVLFFGAIVLSWIYCRHWNPAGFDAGAQKTQLAIGTVNTVILLTSSLIYSAGLALSLIHI